MLYKGILVLAFLFCLPVFVCYQKGNVVKEEELLKKLRDFALNSQLPPEDLIDEVERKLGNTQLGALVKLLKANVLLQKGKSQLVVQTLDTRIIESKTALGDYGLWLYGKALKESGRLKEALQILDTLIKKYPESLRTEEAKLLAAEIALQFDQKQALIFVEDLIGRNKPLAMLIAARSYKAIGDMENAWKFYRLAIFYDLDGKEALQAQTELSSMGLSATPQTKEEALIRANTLFERKRYQEALKAYDEISSFSELPELAKLRKIITLVNLRWFDEAERLLQTLSSSTEQAYHHLALGYASARRWSDARRVADLMLKAFPNSDLTVRTLVSLSFIARDSKNKLEQRYYIQRAINNFPDSTEVAKAQFELAWLEHDAGNFQVSSKMFIEHLAKYVDKDSSYRGRAGYWAARDSERVGRFAQACALYEALVYRYHANWYGYLAVQRLNQLKNSGRCDASVPTERLLRQAINNLKTVKVASESITPKEESRIIRARQLSSVGLFDWAMEELREASKSAPNSPKLNLEIAKNHRLRGDNTSALLSLARSYPDYTQMFPEELSREEWAIFYPLEHWDRIKFWASQRNLDPYQVAGLIRQESVFNPRAKSSANAYGLMQLLIPTARSVARKYGVNAVITEETLYQPDLNIALGTAYLRDMLDRFGRIEYAAAAYNAGPGRIPQWRASLPAEIDEFVEAIPFSETRGYVQGVIRNTAQYRRLYDENGNFRPNVGTKIEGTSDNF